MVTKRWTRYGKDRLYVSLSDGTQVGWVDLVAGEERILLPEHTAEFRRTVAEVAPGRQMPQRGEPIHTEDPPVHPQPAAAPETASHETGSRQHAPIELVPSEAQRWVDLADRRPGEGVRERAREALAAMKEKSKVRTFLARLTDANTDERSWRIGADGEETVGSKLSRLADQGWRVLHSVPVGERDADIDHVLIGPAGVFTINTKTHPGKRVTVYSKAVYVGGTRTDYLRNSRHEAERASRLLARAVERPVIVKPVLVILTARFQSTVTIKQPPGDVLILTGADVPRAFTRWKPILTMTEVESVYAQARRSTTWVPSRGPSGW
jgi:hypothetical protein